MRRSIRATLAALAMTGAVATPALAERDPDYAKVRAEGRVGEQPDGYLGVVGDGDAEAQKIANDINIKRRAVYVDGAQKNAATLEAYAFAAGCTAIQRTAAGEKYRAPDGTWQTRTGAPPMLHPQCPKS